MDAVGLFWILLLSHLLGNYWVDSNENETCLLGSPQCLVVQALNQILAVDKFHMFGSQLGLSETLHSSPCYRISSGTTERSWSKLPDFDRLSV